MAKTKQVERRYFWVERDEKGRYFLNFECRPPLSYLLLMKRCGNTIKRELWEKVK